MVLSQHLSQALTSLPNWVKPPWFIWKTVSKHCGHQSFKFWARPYLSRIELWHSEWSAAVDKFLPSACEMQKVIGYTKDPLEKLITTTKAIVHKYNVAYWWLPSALRGKLSLCFSRHFLMAITISASWVAICWLSYRRKTSWGERGYSKRGGTHWCGKTALLAEKFVYRSLASNKKRLSIQFTDYPWWFQLELRMTCWHG